jgi:DNA polymerase III subunit epsilon
VIGIVRSSDWLNMVNNTRQIILDTETTGLVPEEGHRVIEIGAVELIERRFTGNVFHQYINPERAVESGALLIHGISNDFLADKPLFIDIVEKFINFVAGAEIIIHNAPFDVGFLNYEFKLIDPKAKLLEHYARVFDTLSFARKKHPGKKNSLDALCKRYGVDNTKRELHGALLDAYLLAEVYLIMTSGQRGLFEDDIVNQKSSRQQGNQLSNEKKQLVNNVIQPTIEENAAHKAMLEVIRKASQGKVVWDEA